MKKRFLTVLAGFLFFNVVGGAEAAIILDEDTFFSIYENPTTVRNVICNGHGDASSWIVRGYNGGVFWEDCDFGTGSDAPYPIVASNGQFLAVDSPYNVDAQPYALYTDIGFFGVVPDTPGDHFLSTRAVIIYNIQSVTIIAQPENESPVAIAGDDQVVFDTVTLDGSDSYDPDGEIVSYDWNLEYVDNDNYDRTASGVNPTIPDLYPGFYNTYLTVTDNEGATNTDTSLVAAAGSCPCSCSDLTQCSTDLAQSEADLTQSEANFAQCTSNLNQCETELDQCLNPPVVETEGPGQTCFDDKDNDSDGLIDCDDPDCSKRKQCK